VDADWVLRRLQAELEADASDLFADDGMLKPVAQWPQIWRRGMVTALRVTQLYEKDGTGKNIEIGVVKDVQFADRTRKIELLGKHVAIGAFKERVALGTDDPLKKLYEQIAGQAIRPAGEIQTIEHQPQPDPETEGDA
jgi:phage terminase small subunit